MNILQNKCIEIGIPTAKKLAEKLGNSILLPNLINIYDNDIELLNGSLKDGLSLCKGLGISPEELVDIQAIKHEATRAWDKYYSKHPKQNTIKKAYYAFYLLLKKGNERNIITTAECDEIIQQVKVIKDSYTDDKVDEFVVSMRKIYAPYSLRNKSMGEYTVKMNYYKFIYNIKMSIIMDVLQCSMTYYNNYSTGYLDIGNLPFINAIRLAVLCNTSVEELFDKYFNSLL